MTSLVLTTFETRAGLLYEENEKKPIGYVMTPQNPLATRWLRDVGYVAPIAYA